MTQPNQSELKLNDIITFNSNQYRIVGLSQMIYDEDCEGEPEWKITHEIQEVAIADADEGVTYQKPAWIKVSDITANYTPNSEVAEREQSLWAITYDFLHGVDRGLCDEWERVIAERAKLKEVK